MANTHSNDTLLAFHDQDFALGAYSDCPDNFYTRRTKNLFTCDRFSMLCGKAIITNRVFSLIEPALCLTLRIIIKWWKPFQIPSGEQALSKNKD